MRKEDHGRVESTARSRRDFELGAQVDLAESLYYSHLFAGDEERAQAHYLQEATDLIEAANQAAEAELGHMHPITIQARGLTYSMAFSKSMETLDLGGIQPSFQQQLDDCRQVFGPHHLNTAAAASALGFIELNISEDNERPKQLLTEALKIYADVGGTGSGVADAEQYLGIVFMREGRLEEAETLLRKSVETYEQLYGKESPAVVNLRAALSMALLSQGKFEEGEPLWEHVVELLSTGKAGSAAAAGVFRMRMGRAYAYIRFQQDGVDEVIQELIDDMVEANGPGDPVTLSTAMGLCRLLHDRGGEQAIVMLESLLQKARHELPSPNSTLLLAEFTLAHGYMDSGEYDKSDELIQRLTPEMTEAFGPGTKTRSPSRHCISGNLEYQGRLDEAIIPAADLHERLSSTLGEDHADTLQAEGVLNSLYVDSGRWNDVDTIMAIRRTRWDDDPDELVKLTLLISNNTTSDYKERYLDLALDSAQRAVALRVNRIRR